MNESEALIDGQGSLRYFLALALQGEREQMEECERYPFFGGKNQEILDRLLEGCEEHCCALEELGGSLELDLDGELKQVGTFWDSGRSGKKRIEVAEDLLERGELLLDLYKRLISWTDEGFVESLWNGKRGYFEVLKEVASEEKDKVEDLKRLVRRVELLPTGRE